MEPKCKLTSGTSSLIPHRESESETKIKLITNCFNIDIPNGYVYHYDMEINYIREEENLCPDNERKSGFSNTLLAPRISLSGTLKRKIIQRMIEGNQKFFGLHAAYDGYKNLYIRNKLKCRRFPLKLKVQMFHSETAYPASDRIDKYEVIIKPVKKKGTDSCAINLDSLHAFLLGKGTRVPQEVALVVETVLRQSTLSTNEPRGRSFLYPPLPQDLHSLGSGREMWFGYYPTLLLGPLRPVVNLDIRATTFYGKGPVVQFIASILNTTVDNLRQKTQLSDIEIRRLTSELKNMRIETNYLQGCKRKYRIIRLTMGSARKLEFTLTVNGTERRMTVADYFKMQYNIVLQFPQLPCLQVNPEAKRVYLPLEVCDIIEGQRCRKKLEERQQAEMIRFTARKPQDRFYEIENIVRRSDYDKDPYLKKFGIEVDPRPVPLDGRVIESPNIRYLYKQIVKPRDGSWDMRDKQFVRPVQVGSWVLLSFANRGLCDQQDLNRFTDVLCNVARKTGMVINHPSAIEIVDYRKVKILNLFQSIKQKYEANFMVVVLPKEKYVYGEVKQAAETTVGLITQCIMPESVMKKCTSSLVRNLCQKINIKMGGLNNCLSFELEHTRNKVPVMVVAVHVIRPNNLSSSVNCSIVSVVGILDEDLSQYAVSINAQASTSEKGKNVEIIREFKFIVVNLLEAFSRKTKGKMPEKIIVYRSSVSKSQLKNVKETEVRYIREACKAFAENYKPGVTFIAVQNCNHIRFKPENEEDGVGKMKNIPPGVVVYDTITDPQYQDFLLCSHLAEQGTSRATRYTVLENDTDMTSGEIQKLTYDLCHSYAPSTSSISTPAPVRYARLAARRAWCHLQCYEENSHDGFQPILTETALKVTKVVDAMKNTMYFV